MSQGVSKYEVPEGVAGDIVQLTGTDVAGNVSTTDMVLYRTAPDTTPPPISSSTTHWS